MNPLVIAFDFDGTCCEDNFPSIGAPNEKVLSLMRRIKESGGAVILWTCRQGKYLEEAVAWLKKHNIEVDKVNESLDEWVKAYGEDPRKIGFAYTLDDRAFNVRDVSELEMKIFGNRERCNNYYSNHDGITFSE